MRNVIPRYEQHHKNPKPETDGSLVYESQYVVDIYQYSSVIYIHLCNRYMDGF